MTAQETLVLGEKRTTDTSVFIDLMVEIITEVTTIIIAAIFYGILIVSLQGGSSMTLKS